MKRIITLFLAAMMVISIIPFTAVETEAITLEQDDKMFTITYKPGDGKGKSYEEDYNEDDGAYLDSCRFTHEDDFDFAGWKISGTIYGAGKKFKGTGGSSYTATAQWKEKITITYNPGEGSGTAKTYTYDSGESFKLIKNPFEHDKKKFVGWEYGGKVYKAGTEVSATFDVTFTAEWESDITYSEDWDGTTLNEAQVVDGIYQIGKASELAWFASAINSGEIADDCSAVLTGNINLNNHCYPAIEYFCGHFNGQGYAIDNYFNSVLVGSRNALDNCRPFFKEINGYSDDEKAVIENFTVSGKLNITASYSIGNALLGGIVGDANYAVLKNLTSYMDITINRINNNGSWYGTGGIVGHTNYCEIIGCAFNGTIKGVSNLGGIAGVCYYTMISNTVNNGEICGEDSGGESYIGGIVGGAYSETNIFNCSNFGKIEGTGTCIGGIVGYIRSNSEIKNSFNKGVIKSESSSGGIAGAIWDATVIDSCYNVGTVSGESAAGIVCGSDYATISYCYNLGDVCAEWYNAGGIVCRADNSIISCCYNAGEINHNGTYYGCAGIASESSYSEISNCYNIGDITGNAVSAGIGYEFSYVTLFNCFSLGKITGEEAAYAVTKTCTGTMEKIYYLDSSCENVYDEIPADAEEPVAMTAEEMASEDFVNLLNQNAGEAIFEKGESHPVFSKKPAVLLGDVSGDKKITLRDAMLIYDYCHAEVNFTKEQTLLADLNGDQKITPADADIIFDYCNGLGTVANG